ncbi:PssD/Cps14F family polysaccharide biosynthesis glycosyltransferase [Arthrobacter sp. MDB2-24]
MKILFVASTGGHLAQLLSLRHEFSGEKLHWVTFRKRDAETALVGEDVTWAYHPTTRNIPNALRNLALALPTLMRVRPDVVISTGAGVSVPFFLVARLLRIRTVYIEVIDRIEQTTLSGRLCYPLADAFCVQWPAQQRLYSQSTVIGPTL